MTAPPPGPVSCARCAATAPAAPDGPAAPLSWSLEQTGRGPQWLCGPCTREHLRSIEGRLDELWW